MVAVRRWLFVLALLYSSVPSFGQERCKAHESAAELACVGDFPSKSPRLMLHPDCYEPLDPPAPGDRYAALREEHRLEGNACYYSAFFHGRKTANGEIFRNDRFSAAHLTLPLGTLVEIEALASGRKLRLRVNDRGPYTGPFIIDLSRAAARELGVDKGADRRVKVSVLALPGDEWYEAESKGGSAPAEIVTSAKSD
jgi:rare lipoprotein A (peptidoglycan hydrolase)